LNFLARFKRSERVPVATRTINDLLGEEGKGGRTRKNIPCEQRKFISFIRWIAKVAQLKRTITQSTQYKIFGGDYVTQSNKICDGSQRLDFGNAEPAAELLRHTSC
jgi:hypothetical protein